MKSQQHHLDLPDEDGAILVIFAAALTAIILLVAFVVDVANWYEHKRHLQTQADAAALAGATSFKLIGCSDTEIYKAVQQYSGVKDTTLAASPYNVQIGRTLDSNVHILVNS